MTQVQAPSWNTFGFWFFQRGTTPEREITRTRKNNMGQLFFHEESIYEISKPYYALFIRYGMHQKEWQMDTRTDTRKQYAPIKMKFGCTAAKNCQSSICSFLQNHTCWKWPKPTPGSSTFSVLFCFYCHPTPSTSFRNKLYYSYWIFLLNFYNISSYNITSKSHFSPNNSTYL